MSTEILGWREWCTLPEFDIPGIKVKVDTGARTSALHTFHIEPVLMDEQLFVKFKVRPHPKRKTVVYTCLAKVADTRWVTDSGGHTEKRFFIRTPIKIGDTVRLVEVSLTNRDNMRFRMLLGRSAFSGLGVVDPTKSYMKGRMSYKTLYPRGGVQP
jgi:hypothetical protein